MGHRSCAYARIAGLKREHPSISRVTFAASAEDPRMLLPHHGSSPPSSADTVPHLPFRAIRHLARLGICYRRLLETMRDGLGASAHALTYPKCSARGMGATAALYEESLAACAGLCVCSARLPATWMRSSAVCETTWSDAHGKRMPRTPSCGRRLTG